MAKRIQQPYKISPDELNGDLMTYFNWSANALVPVNPGGADRFLKENRSSILKTSQKLLRQIGYVPRPIYRGVILKEAVDTILPHKNLEYLSFSSALSVAEHFADINGFGSEHTDVGQQLGTHGYVIEYSPRITEVLFHYHLLSVLPYAQAFNRLGMNGTQEVEGLKRQREIMILQPAQPFTNIQRRG